MWASARENGELGLVEANLARAIQKTSQEMIDRGMVCLLLKEKLDSPIDPRMINNKGNPHIRGLKHGIITELLRSSQPPPVTPGEVRSSLLQALNVSPSPRRSLPRDPMLHSSLSLVPQTRVRY
jgi:hypothetical protein